MTSSIQALREALKVPLRGRIDFQDVLGSSLSEAIDRWKQGHFPMRRHIVHRINFDDFTVNPGGNYAEIIDDRYKASHGVEFRPFKHIYVPLPGPPGFEAMQPHFVGYDNPKWVEPHVWAVADWGLKSTSQALSSPNCVNVSHDRTGEVNGQWMSHEKAIRINFDPPACAVQMRSNYKPSAPGQSGTIHNWPQMLAYNNADELLSMVGGRFGGLLTVSSWADDIAYVMVTVDNQYAGPEPLGLFDDLQWTTIEFVLQIMKKLRDAPKPVPRGALVDQVLHRIEGLQVAQQRLQKRLAQVGDAKLAAQLQADWAEAMTQTDALLGTYRKATHDTLDHTAAPLPA